MGNPFQLLKSSVSEPAVVDTAPVLASSVRSEPNVRVGMNIMLATHSHGKDQISSIDADIQKAMKKLDELQRDKAFMEVMVQVATEYHSGVHRPTCGYPLSADVFPE